MDSRGMRRGVIVRGNLADHKAIELVLHLLFQDFITARRIDRIQVQVLQRCTISTQHDVEGRRNRSRHAVGGIRHDDLLAMRLCQRRLDNRHKHRLDGNRQCPAIVRRLKRIERDIAYSGAVQPIVATTDLRANNGMIELGNFWKPPVLIDLVEDDTSYFEEI